MSKEQWMTNTPPHIKMRFNFVVLVLAAVMISAANAAPTPQEVEVGAGEKRQFCRTRCPGW
ncbi:uncharacterized protein FA14DRAFT_177342 [Meira miltonrushii]|uniref:Uncharacterized protein n=1 Tax=Meira miltonrushii TaxID=1280837 RepID=A0A316VRE3_9BASI|nr:uncharacterized protein FA14DRAFT_177342 [Meira miltonrushii]PWN38065.1 hypothetical protein FA14DRAFT_177342 [Meira miltonrushii]